MDKIIEITTNATVFEACKLMNAHSISSLPLFDTESNSYIGFISNFDIVRYVATLVEDKKFIVSSITRKLQTDVCGSLPLKQGFCPVVIENPSDYFDIFASIIDITGHMKRGDSRVPIVDKEGKIVKLITQSNIIKYFAQHLDEQDKKLISSSISDLNLVNDDEKNPLVIGVYTYSSVLEGMDKLVSNNLSAIAVFTEDGELLTNLSASDIVTGIVKQMNFHQSAQSFISEIRTKHSNLFKTGGKDFPAAVTGSKDTSLKNVIGKLAATGLHRLFITDSTSRKCIGVVSLQGLH